MKATLALSALLASSAFGALPAGISGWSIAECQTAEEQDRNRCARFWAEVVILRLDSEVCGFIAESWSPKSPRGWFAGTIVGEQALLKFVDSFQEGENETGTAVLVPRHGGVEWRVVQSPPNGLLSSTGLMRRDREAEASVDPKPTSCAEFERNHSPVTYRLKQ